MVKKPRNDAQIKVEHVAEFVGKQGAMRDDLIEVEPTNIKGLMASLDQCVVCFPEARFQLYHWVGNL